MPGDRTARKEGKIQNFLKCRLRMLEKEKKVSEGGTSLASPKNLKIFCNIGRWKLENK
jgi:hypothetical protein